jgi:predicted dehydrogenase
MKKKLRLAMIGGGEGSFIGAVHRMAASLDDEYELVCGTFSSDAERSRKSGEALGLPPDRVYDSFADLFEREKLLPESVRAQVVSIVTPNHAHFEPAKLALGNGMHVITDKPMTFSYSEAEELYRIAGNSHGKFCVTYTYTGYPMIKEARRIVRDGRLGQIRKVHVEYPQGWLSSFEEGGENKQAKWRTDPGKSGKAGAMGDIGTHAFHLAEYVSNLRITHLSADVNTVVQGRALDDDGAVLLKFSNGASGTLLATQVATGEENNLRIRVYGDRGGLEWQQYDANSLVLKWPDQPAQHLRTGASYLSSYARHNTRIPAGHPEGFIEAFGNIYRNFALSIKAADDGAQPEQEWLDYPGVYDGLRGMAFIESVISSGQSQQKWTPLTAPDENH